MQFQFFPAVWGGPVLGEHDGRVGVDARPVGVAGPDSPAAPHARPVLRAQQPRRCRLEPHPVRHRELPAERGPARRRRLPQRQLPRLPDDVLHLRRPHCQYATRNAGGAELQSTRLRPTPVRFRWKLPDLKWSSPGVNQQPTGCLEYSPDSWQAVQETD